MKSSVKRTYLDKEYTYLFKDKVIKLDYYKDHLVAQLPGVMRTLLKKKKTIDVLDMATGHGYTAVIVGNYYEPYLNKMVAYDINPKAVEVATANVLQNDCNMEKIDFRVGTIYEPLKKGETFDLIISALPPVPVESDQLAAMPEDVKVHHWVKSTAGRTGRDLLDSMIKDAYKRLNPGGMIITTQSDFQNATIDTPSVMKKYGLKPELIGEPAAQKIKNTKLTLLRRDHIMSLGYTFTKDKDGDEQFFIQTYIGTKV